MGDLFAQPELQARSNLSPQQQSLHSPLAGFLQQFFGGTGNGMTPEMQGLQKQLLSSGSDQSQQMAQDIFSKALLGPALRGYDQQIAPRINESFAKIGGTLSSRRNDLQARTLGDITTNATGQLAGMLPQIMSFPLQQTLGQIQGLGALQQQQFTPYSEALKFALTGTQQSQTTPAGMGWGLLDSAIKATGFALGGLGG